MPAAGEQVWYWFRELDAQRQSNGFGPNAISFQEIRAWRLERGIDPLLPWQLDALIAMDLKRRALALEQKAEPEKAAEVSERPLTSKVFDALFGTK